MNRLAFCACEHRPTHVDDYARQGNGEKEGNMGDIYLPFCCQSMSCHGAYTAIHMGKAKHAGTECCLVNK